MAYEQIILAKSSGVVTITFNRPDKLNAFTFKMLEEVNQALRRATISQGWAERGIRWMRCARGIMR
jgi:enoyl-CoA hydratase/carnithine racemase